MSKFEIHIPAKKKVFANPDDRPVIRISPSAYNALIEIGNESTASIKDIAVKWGDNFGQQFKGKLIGGIFRVEKDWYNGKEVKHRKLAWFRSIEGIKDADIPEERTTRAYDDHLKEEAIMGANPSGTDFMNIPDSMQEELPFN